MKCPQCGQDVSPHSFTCPVCQQPLGFPNVRAASEQPERDALGQRYSDTRNRAQSRGADDQITRFEQAMSESQAVIAQREQSLVLLFDKDCGLFKTFYRQLDDGEREPLDNGFDQQRQGVDATYFPHYFKEIHFAALSLNGCGLESYGEWHLTLRTPTIAHRSSVFEENTLVFTQKHGVNPVDGPPAGYRAAWDARQRLAVAKLGDAIDGTTAPRDYPGILMKQTGQTDQDDFIEVHIYGTLDERCIESFRLPRKPKNKEARVEWLRLKRRLEKAGATERTN